MQAGIIHAAIAPLPKLRAGFSESTTAEDRAWSSKNSKACRSLQLSHRLLPALVAWYYLLPIRKLSGARSQSLLCLYTVARPTDPILTEAVGLYCAMHHDQLGSVWAHTYAGSVTLCNSSHILMSPELVRGIGVEGASSTIEPYTPRQPFTRLPEMM